MRKSTTTLATLTLAGLCATFAAPAWAQQTPDQPAAQQPYNGQQAAPTDQQAYPQQPYQQQPYQAQPYQAQPYQPQPYQAQPYQPQPYYPQQPGYATAPQGTVRYVRRPRTGLIIAGAVVLGASWLTSVAVSTLIASAGTTTTDYYGNSYYSSSLDFSHSWPLLIPVLGPWIQMGYTGNGEFAGLANVMLGFDGLVQAGGLAMLIAGAVTHTKVAVYAKNNLQVTPLFLTNSSGLMVSGRF